MVLFLCTVGLSKDGTMTNKLQAGRERGDCANTGSLGLHLSDRAIFEPNSAFFESISMEISLKFVRNSRQMDLGRF